MLATARQVCSGRDGYGQHKAVGGPLDRGAFLQSGGSEECELLECELLECKDGTCFSICQG